MQYLVRKRLTGRAHAWLGHDTLCQMASSGGLDQRRYRIYNYPPRPICQMCKRQAKALGILLDRGE